MKVYLLMFISLVYSLSSYGQRATHENLNDEEYIKKCREVSAEEVRQIHWRKSSKEQNQNIIVPHQMSIFLKQYSSLEMWRKIAIIDYTYTMKFRETAELVVQENGELALKIERSIHLSQSTIPYSVHMEGKFSATPHIVFTRFMHKITDYNPLVELFSSATVFPLVKNSKGAMYLMPFKASSSSTPLEFSKIDRGERISELTVSALGSDTYLANFNIDLNIENAQADTAPLFQNNLKSRFYEYGVKNVLPGPIDIKFYVSGDLSELFVKVKDEIYSFENTQIVEVERKVFHPRFLTEIELLLGQLKFLKPSLRLNIYEETYGQIENSLLGIKKIIQKEKLSHLSAVIQNQYESVFFLYKNILFNEIKKDVSVESYGQYAASVCEHLEYCNQNFFQFDPGAPSSAVISMIAKHVSLMLEKSKLAVDNYRLTHGRELKQKIDGLFLKTFELSTLEAVGDADAGLLNQLDELIIAYAEVQRQLESGLGEHPEAQMLYGQIHLGMSFLRKIRE